MRCALVLAALAAICILSPAALGKGGGSHGSYSTGTHGHYATLEVERDSRGHVKRSEQAKDGFKNRILVHQLANRPALVRAM